MRKLLTMLTMAGAILAASALMTPRAEAMTVSAPAGLAAAIKNDNLAEQIWYGCRGVWRCGYWGCGWRRICYGGPSYYGYGYGYGYGYRPYYYPRPYYGYYRPYYRPYYGYYRPYYRPYYGYYRPYRYGWYGYRRFW